VKTYKTALKNQSVFFISVEGQDIFLQGQKNQEIRRVHLVCRTCLRAPYRQASDPANWHQDCEKEPSM